MSIPREAIIDHIEANGCVIKDEYEFDDGEWYINVLENQACFIPFEEMLDHYTWANAIYELRVPPFPGREQEYERYRLFREMLNAQRAEAQKE